MEPQTVNAKINQHMSFQQLLHIRHERRTTIGYVESILFWIHFYPFFIPRPTIKKLNIWNKKFQW